MTIQIYLEVKVDCPTTNRKDFECKSDEVA